MNVDTTEAEVLAAEALSLAGELAPGARRSGYEALARAAAGGEVPAELEEQAGALAGLAVESGKARAMHGPGGERALEAVWRRSPQGREAAADCAELNTALTALRGRPLGAVQVAATGPGRHALTIGAGEVELRLAIDGAGVRLRSLEVGGEAAP